MKTHHLTALILSILLAAAQPVRADEIPQCACTERAFDERWNDAAAVFTGTVTDISPSREFSGARPKGSKFKTGDQADLAVVVTLNVDESYKGIQSDQKTFKLHTSLTRYTCTGHPFEKDKQYLVFAYERKDYSYNRQELYRFPIGTFDVGGLCGGTKEFSKASDDLQYLRPQNPSGVKKLLNNLQGKGF